MIYSSKISCQLWHINKGMDIGFWQKLNRPACCKFWPRLRLTFIFYFVILFFRRPVMGWPGQLARAPVKLTERNVVWTSNIAVLQSSFNQTTQKGPQPNWLCKILGKIMLSWPSNIQYYSFIKFGWWYFKSTIKCNLIFISLSVMLLNFHT